jgi:hypothetical protein
VQKNQGFLIVITLIVAGMIATKVFGANKVETPITSAKCQIESLVFSDAKNVCLSSGGKVITQYISQWRRSGFALLTLDDNTIADAETSAVDMKALIGEVDSTIVSPKIMLAKIDQKQAVRLKNKFHITGIYFGKADLNLVEDESDKDWLSIWNSDEQQVVGCECSGDLTWGCDNGCTKLNKEVCMSGGGKWEWWKSSCKCDIGKTWYKDRGRCDDVTVETNM